MQKVVGSSPIIRSKSDCSEAFLLSDCETPRFFECLFVPKHEASAPQLEEAAAVERLFMRI
jgi:hypothetical protein